MSFDPKIAGVMLIRMSQPQSAYVYQDLRHVEGDTQPFDRVAYAMRALRVLRPRGLTVAVHQGNQNLRVERGKSWGRGENESWAVVSIPPDATREAIALALADLAGLRDNSLALAVLMTATDPAP
jgi:hypothetical protein